MSMSWQHLATIMGVEVLSVSPVAANEGVGEVPRPHAFIGVEGDDVSDFPAVDDFFSVR